MSFRPEELVTTEAQNSDPSDSNDKPKKNTRRTFRDGVREIDLILVVKDEENVIADSMKNNFFANIVKMGLEIEHERGLLPIHKKLVFFKVHCPNDVLNNLGNAFGVKCVQSTRAERIMAENEREWIYLVRKEYIQPLQYSNLNRSLVVYMTLLNVAFGDRQNYIGLERLLKRNIVVDAYALHDGPYFITDNLSHVNARQILFYNWVGIKNIFKRQPLNLIHEYFGPKIALYFAFYGLYNFVLAIAAIGALITLFLAVFKNENYIALIAPICDTSTEAWICFWCNETDGESRCWAERRNIFCTWFTMNVMTDNKYTPFFSAFIILWGILFTAFWLGREKYLNWIWEADNKEYNRKQTRPEFEVEKIQARKSKKTGITIIGKSRDGKIKILASYFGIFLLVSFAFAAMLLLREFLPKTLVRLFGPIFIHPPNVLTFAFITSIIVIVIVYYISDQIYRKVAHFIVEKENHRTYKSYNRSLTKHLYIMCFALPFIVLAYDGFRLAHFQLWRGHNDRGLDYLTDDTCLMISCLYELSFTFTIVILITFTIFRKLSRSSSVTDYNQGASVEKVPCWEREYILPRFKEDILINKMKVLVIQFIFIIMFAIAFPPAILIVLFFNIYNLRRDTELFTLHYRRPLLLKDEAFNIWSTILKLMVYLAIFINVVTFICSTDCIETYLREQRMETGPDLSHYLDLFFYYRPSEERSCHVRGFLHVIKADNDPNNLTKQLTVDELRTYQYMYIFIFEIFMSAVFMSSQYIFSIDVDELEIPRKRLLNHDITTNESVFRGDY